MLQLIFTIIIMAIIRYIYIYIYRCISSNYTNNAEGLVMLFFNLRQIVPAVLESSLELVDSGWPSVVVADVEVMASGF